MGSATDFRKSEEERIKAHLGQLFTDAFLSDASSEARARMIDGLATELLEAVATDKDEALQSFLVSLQAEKAALIEEREKFLSALSEQVSSVAARSNTFLDPNASGRAIKTGFGGEFREGEQLRGAKTAGEVNGSGRAGEERLLIGGVIGAISALCMAAIGVGLHNWSGQTGSQDQERLEFLAQFCQAHHERVIPEAVGSEVAPEDPAGNQGIESTPASGEPRADVPKESEINEAATASVDTRYIESSEGTGNFDLDPIWKVLLCGPSEEVESNRAAPNSDSAS